MCLREYLRLEDVSDKALRLETDSCDHHLDKKRQRRRKRKREDGGGRKGGGEGEDSFQLSSLFVPFLNGCKRTSFCMDTSPVADGYRWPRQDLSPKERDDLEHATKEYGDLIGNVVRDNVNTMLIGTSTHFIRARKFRHWAEMCLATVPGRPSLRISCEFKLELDFPALLDKEDVSADDGPFGSTMQQRDCGYEDVYRVFKRQDGASQDSRRNEKPSLTLATIVEMRKLKLDRMSLAIMRSVSKKLFHIKRARPFVQNRPCSNDAKGPEPSAVVPELGRDGDDVTSSLVSTESPFEVSDSSD